MSSALDLASAYMNALGARDYEVVSDLLAPEVRLRDLSPPGFTELTGVEGAIGYLAGFLDSFDEVALVDSDVYDVGTMTYARARMRFVRSGSPERVLEQHHFLTVDAGRIAAIDELCSGLQTV
jgi:ketosteroid isomerase-like protein